MKIMLFHRPNGMLIFVRLVKFMEYKSFNIRKHLSELLKKQRKYSYSNYPVVVNFFFVEEKENCYPMVNGKK